MIVRYLDMLGSMDEVLKLLESFERPLKPVIRCNKLKVHDCRYLVNRLSKLGYTLERLEWEPTAYRVLREGSPSLGATHEFLLGFYYLYRGSASLLPPIILNPSPKDLVLDLAAAPGGKTTHMAQIMGNEGVIVAVDISRIRIRALRSNLERLGVRNTVILRMDGTKINDVFKNYFTKSLLDAPCSAEGLIQIDKTRKVKTELRDLLKFRELQLSLLNAAINATTSGGYILYTTCSIAPEENELVIAEILSTRDDVRMVPIPKIINFSDAILEYLGMELPQDLKYCVRTYPHIQGMEGFFLCLMRRY
ncbi:MAG TPA: RsmB/NOP family class I SAM-dependent RNA methyltransferase [Acidilobales archaeon]|nr:RsmB/NOP family class I SAM-dependent RNA methyltransferase [Acidilobales archaeon]